MKHPTQEQWMDYLYEETSGAANEGLARHLEDCQECQGVVAAWRGAKAQLDEWPIPASPGQPGIFRTRVAWGLAAAITLFLGAGLGQLTARSTDAARVAQILEPKLRAQIKSVTVQENQQSLRTLEDQLALRVRQKIEAEIDQKLADASVRASQEMERLVVRMADSLNNLRETDKAELLGLLKQTETYQLARLASIRKDLETVAIVGQAKIDDAQQEIGHLASVSQTLYHPNSQNH